MDSPLIYLLFSVVMLALAFVGLHYWGHGTLSCAELLGGGLLMLLFFTLFSVPWGFPLNLLLLLIPVGYVASNVLLKRSLNRTLREMRSSDYTACHRVIAQDPRNAAAHARLAEMLEEDGHLQEAFAAYQQVVTLEPSNIAARRKLDRMTERIGLAESGQIKCPGCFTIQPAHDGYCWKCGRIYHKQKALITRVKRLGIPGRIALLTLAASVSLAGTAGVSAVFGKGEALVSTLVIPGAVVAACSFVWLNWMLFRLAEREAMERES